MLTLQVFKKKGKMFSFLFHWISLQVYINLSYLTNCKLLTSQQDKSWTNKTCFIAVIYVIVYHCCVLYSDKLKSCSEINVTRTLVLKDCHLSQNRIYEQWASMIARLSFRAWHRNHNATSWITSSSIFNRQIRQSSKISGE